MRSSDGTKIAIRRVSDGKVIGAYREPPAGYFVFGYSINSTREAVYLPDKTLQLLDAVTGELLTSIKVDFPGARGRFLSTGRQAVTADGKFVLLTTRDGHVAIVRLPDAKPASPRPVLTLPLQTTTPVPISVDGRLVANPVASSERNVGAFRVFDTETGERVNEVKCSGEFMTCANFTPDGSKIVAGIRADQSRYFIRVWDLKTGTARRLDQLENIPLWPGSLHLSRDANRLVMSLLAPGDRASEVRVVDLVTGMSLLTIPAPRVGGKVGMMARLSADGKSCVTATIWSDDPNATHLTKGQLRIDDLEGKQPPLKIDTNYVWDPFFDPATGEVGALRWARELSPWVEYWNPANGKSLRQHPLPRAAVEVTLAPEGKRALVIDKDRQLGVYDLPSGDEILRLDRVVSNYGISADGRCIQIGDQRERWVYRLPAPGAKVAVPDAKPVSLRGPGPKVGQVVRDEMTLKMTDGTFSVTAGGVTETGKMTMTGDAVYEEEVLAVGGGEITKSRTRVVREKTTARVTFEGVTDSHDDTSPLEGEMVELEKVGAEWKRSLVGKVPTDEQKEDLKFFPPPIPDAEFYPAEPVKPGHSWNPYVTKLTRHLGLPMPVQIEGGTWKMTFVRVTTVNGEECAEIAEEVDVRAKVKGEKGAGTIAVKVRGTTHRSLKTGVSVESRFAGTMSVTGTKTVEGQAVQIAMSGSVEVNLKSLLK